ncbi:glutathione S-transferase family protein [Caulobacter mirabilis]|uniref:glutathione transferase n=1 Tax=Caulobacter mirabilis TaxID=69666 RepID=A0A2D2B0M0_9CAUL|nr:glutathione S-transferase family protein [Caulobacter mirabilis]ATQ43727.1 glutathione S-transferase [Caulobacter mirabilis]
MTSTTPKLTLISFPLCPYVQRAIIALEEKGAPFDVVYIDLANKPDWFLKLSPLGKVPVLKVEREGQEPAVVFESSVIVEYLEETAPGAKLHPADPLERAQHRAWMEYASATLADLYRLNTAVDAADLPQAREAAIAKLRRLEDVLAPEGPYFAGAAFSYVDAAFAPAFRQIGVVDTVAETHLLDGLPRVSAWAKALAERPSVKAAVPTDYPERYLAWLRDKDAAVLKLAA